MPATPMARAGVAGPTSVPTRAVRLKRGAQPTHSSMSGFQRWAWSTFRSRVLARPPDPNLDENLVKAHIRMRSDEYLAVVYATTLVVGIATAVAGVVVGYLFVSSGVAFLGILIGVLLPVFGTIGAFFVLKGTRRRRRRTGAARSTGRSPPR